MIAFIHLFFSGEKVHESHSLCLPVLMKLKIEVRSSEYVMMTESWSDIYGLIKSEWFIKLISQLV